MTRQIDGKFGNQSTGIFYSVILLLVGVSMVIASAPMPKAMVDATPARSITTSMLIPMTTWSVLALAACIFFMFCYRNVQNQPSYLDIVNNKRSKWFSYDGRF